MINKKQSVGETDSGRGIMRREERVEGNQWEEMLVREEKERGRGERGHNEDYFDKGKNNNRSSIRRIGGNI